MRRTLCSPICRPTSRLEAACGEVGRDPATLGVTVLAAVAYPDLGPPSTWMTEPLSGSSEEVATAMVGYRQMGVAHLMFHGAPYNSETLKRLGEAVNLYRSMTAPQST